MIRDQGVETIRGHPRQAVFDAALAKANWPKAAGVRIGPEEDLLVPGGKVRAELHLPALLLTVTGKVTAFEPGTRIEAAGTQAGISAAMVVRFADNLDGADDLHRDDADDVGDQHRDQPRDQPVETTLTWRFQARLPYWLAIFELPAAAAVKAAIPLLRDRFLANIVRYLDDRESVDHGLGPAGELPGDSEDRVTGG